MKRTVLLLLAGSLALSGCVVLSPSGRLPDDKGFDPDAVHAPRPTLPNVFVVDGHLVVDQEPIRISRRDARDGKVTIAWALSARSTARWPARERAITIRNDKGQTPKDWSCAVSRGEKVLSCSYTFAPGAFKYTLQVRDGSIDLPALDPYIVNIE
jgi:hypothetical protein